GEPALASVIFVLLVAVGWRDRVLIPGLGNLVLIADSGMREDELALSIVLALDNIKIAGPTGRDSYLNPIVLHENRIGIGLLRMPVVCSLEDSKFQVEPRRDRMPGCGWWRRLSRFGIFGLFCLSAFLASLRFRRRR